ncbi:MAG: hypothetical protein Q4F95_14040 [Oscillospiraceae bacterium]|nr:hypothetical protein [Oscillospiraceae bacterium]
MYKKIIILAAVFCLAVSGFSSCKKDNIGQNSDNSAALQTDLSENAASDGTVTSLPVTDLDGNKITVINVTDASGENVLDEKGNPVTQAVIMDKSENIITQADGKPAKPNIQAAQTNSVTTVKGNDPADTDGTQKQEQTDLVDSSGSYKAVVWLNDFSQGTDSNGRVSELMDNGELFTVTFKINDNAPSGDYSVSLKNPQDGDSPYGTFCNGDMETPKELTILSDPGIISVGATSPKAKNDSNSGGTHVDFSNAAGNPGDTVTLSVSIKGNTGIFAFNTWVCYNQDVMTIEKISAGTVLAGNGDFLTG